MLRVLIITWQVYFEVKQCIYLECWDPSDYWSYLLWFSPLESSELTMFLWIFYFQFILSSCSNLCVLLFKQFASWAHLHASSTTPSFLSTIAIPYSSTPSAYSLQLKILLFKPWPVPQVFFTFTIVARGELLVILELFLLFVQLRFYPFI